MSNQSKRTAILAKIQASQGVDSVPTAAANAVMCSTPQFGWQGDEITRNTVRPWLTPEPTRKGFKRQTVRFSVELKGADAGAVIAPKYDPLLQACGLIPGSGWTLTLSGLSGTFTAGEIATAGPLSGPVMPINGSTVIFAISGTGPVPTGGTLTGGTSGATGTIDVSVQDYVAYRPWRFGETPKFCTIYGYRDGLLFTLIDCMGTASLR